MNLHKKSIVYGLIFLLVALFSPIKAQISLSLDEAIQNAYNENYMLKNANLDIENSESVIWEKIAEGLPSVSSKIGYQHAIELQKNALSAKVFNPNAKEGDIEYISFGLPHSLNTQLNIKQLIFSGSYIVSLQASKTYQLIVELSQKKTKASLKKAVISAYSGILVGEKNLELVSKNIDNLKTTLIEIAKRVENGFLNIDEKSRIEIQISQLESQEEAGKQLLENSYQMFKIAIGIDPETSIYLSETLEQVLEKISTIASKEVNIENSIDFKLYESDVLEKKLLLRNEYMSFLPTISMAYNIGFNAFGNSFGFFDKDAYWPKYQNIGVNISIPIFDSFKSVSKINQAKRKYLKAENTRNYKEKELAIKISNAKKQISISKNKYLNSKKHYLLLQEINTKDKTRQEEGVISTVLFLTSLTQLYQSQSEYISSMKDLIDHSLNYEQLTTITE